MVEPVLVADIGGTNARFAIAEITPRAMVIRDAQSFHTEDFETVRDAVEAYLKVIADRPKRACFAAAGPIINNEVEFTNSRWTLRSADIAEPLGLTAFRIVNDFHALAAGVSYLPKDAFVTVKDGAPVAGAPQLVIGPGTGLGQALIVPTDAGSKIVATEGGHVSFAPQTDDELEVTRFIAREHQRVSVERLLSGHGLANIFRALSTIAGAQRPIVQASEVAAAAMTGECPVAVKAVNLFCSVLGSVAGDAVLSTGARGGVVLGGGVLPKIKEIFLKSAFHKRFTDKGRMQSYVDAVPVRMIATDGAALYGAAAVLESEE